MTRIIIALGILTLLLNACAIANAQNYGSARPFSESAVFDTLPAQYKAPVMFAADLVVVMDGATCHAVALCATADDSCEAFVVSCDGPVACPSEGYAADHVDSEEWVEVLGCSTDLSAGWPLSVDIDTMDVYWTAGAK